MTEEYDEVNRPRHYNLNGIEVIDVIETYVKDDYRLGNVLKYVCRSGYKGNKLQDLQKASWYLNRVIEELEDARDLELIEQRISDGTKPVEASVVLGKGYRVGGTEDAHTEMQHAYYGFDPKRVMTYCVQCDRAIYESQTYILFNDGESDLPFCSDSCRSNYLDEL